MKGLWAKVRAFFAKLFGAAGALPVEVAISDALISSWWDIYRA